VPDDTPAIEIALSGEPLLQVWSDGRIAWSGDAISGGSPLQTARIDPAAVTGAIAAIRNSALSGGRWIGDVRTGPGSPVTTVRVTDEDVLIVDVASWHERFEADPRLVVTAGGVEPLGTRRREAVLAQQPGDYQLFRRQWEDVLGRLRRLIPPR
jgi:hypothetical protein